MYFPQNRAECLPGHPIRLGVSSCLLGQRVRYNGDHKLDGYIADKLGRFFELVPICPELAIGLGVPREAMHLVGNRQNYRAIGTQDESIDVTNALAAYGKKMAQELNDISGYILKSKSPSCGMMQVKVTDTHNVVRNNGIGIYARALMKAQPALPLEEDVGLKDPVVRENFLERVFVFRRWQGLCLTGLTSAHLIDFHSRHKLILMAHGPNNHTAELGHMVAKAGKANINELAESYILRLMRSLKQRTTRKRQSNVLMHIMGYLKKCLPAGDKTELLGLIDAYRAGKLPLNMPLTRIKQHFRHHPNSYIEQQAYLDLYTQEILYQSQTEDCAYLPTDSSPSPKPR